MKISKERFNRMNKDFPNMKFYYLMSRTPVTLVIV